MSYQIYETEGFVLEKKDFKEVDSLLFVLTKDFGLIPVLALGLRRLSSKLRYQAATFNHAQFSLVKGREFWRLIAVTETELSWALKIDAQKRAIYLRLLYFLRRFFQGEETEQFLFRDFKQSLIFLAQEDLTPLACKNFECILVLRLLKFLGYLEDESDLRQFLTFSDWSNEIIEVMAEKRPLAVKSINAALAAANV